MARGFLKRFSSTNGSLPREITFFGVIYQMSKTKVNVQDIANLAQVSAGTVSNALNGRPGVSQATKEKIFKIADQLGYQRKGQSSAVNQAIRLIIYKRSGDIVTDTPFFAKLIEGIQAECRGADYEMLITHISKGPDCHSQLNELNNHSVAGCLILATEMLAEDFALFKNLKEPIVFIDSYFPCQRNDFVLINNVDGAYEATQYLIDNGHKSIGYIHSSTSINNFSYRKQGFINALSANGLAVKQDSWIGVRPSLDGAYQDTKQHLSETKSQLPTAFFADNDLIAFGAMSALKEAGYKIPDDVSIIGFDDLPYCEISDPNMTTVRVHKQHFGGIAVKRLIDKIKNNDPLRQKIEVCTELVIRNSVRKVY